MRPRTAQRSCAPRLSEVGVGQRFGRIRPRRREPDDARPVRPPSPRGRPTRRRVVASSSAIRKRCTVSPHRAEPHARRLGAQRGRRGTPMDIHAVEPRRRGALRPSRSPDGLADPIIEAAAPARIRSARVSFDPARAPPGRHPLGQTPGPRLRHRPRPSSGAAACVRSAPGDTVWDRRPAEALARRLAQVCDGSHRDAGGARSAPCHARMETWTDAQYGAAVAR